MVRRLQTQEPGSSSLDAGSAPSQRARRALHSAMLLSNQIQRCCACAHGKRHNASSADASATCAQTFKLKSTAASVGTRLSRLPRKRPFLCDTPRLVAPIGAAGLTCSGYIKSIWRERSQQVLAMLHGSAVICLSLHILPPPYWHASFATSSNAVHNGCALYKLRVAWNVCHIDGSHEPRSPVQRWRHASLSTTCACVMRPTPCKAKQARHTSPDGLHAKHGVLVANTELGWHPDLLGRHQEAIRRWF